MAFCNFKRNPDLNLCPNLFPLFPYNLSKIYYSCYLADWVILGESPPGPQLSTHKMGIKKKIKGIIVNIEIKQQQVC